MPLLLDLPHFSVFSSAAVRCGIDIHEALNELAIETSSQAAPLSQFSLADIARLLETLERKTQRDYFPFALADVFHFEGQPMVAAFISSSRSLREAGDVLEWIPKLIHPAIRFQRKDDGRLTITRIDIVDEQGHVQNMPAFVEVIIAVMCKLSRHIAPHLNTNDAVHFAHAPRTQRRFYQQHLQCPVQFETDANRVVAYSEILDQVLPGNLPSAHAQAAESIRVQLNENGVEPPLPLLIADLLRQNLSFFDSGISAVADALKMHPRRLQRELKKHQLSYSAILAQTRHKLACEMLDDRQLDIESIGYKLGFAERRSFTSAFQKWQGQTPSAYRRKR